MTNVGPGYISTALKSFWYSGAALITLMMAIMAAVYGVAAQQEYGPVPREGTPVAETITWIVIPSTRYTPYLRTVTLQDDNGQSDEITLAVDRIAGCKIGDRVVIYKSRLSFNLAPFPCQHGASHADRTLPMRGVPTVQRQPVFHGS